MYKRAFGVENPLSGFGIERSIWLTIPVVSDPDFLRAEEYYRATVGAAAGKGDNQKG